MDNTQQPRKSGPSFFEIVGIIIFGFLLISLVVGVIATIALPGGRHRATVTSPALVKQQPAGAVAAEEREKTSYILRQPQRLVGRYMVFRLVAYTQAGKMGFSSSKFSSSRTVNYLLVDTTNNNAHWLWTKGMPLVAEETVLYEKGANTGNAAATCMLLALVTADTNKDTYVDDTDKKSLLAIGQDGTLKKVMDGIDLIHSITQVDSAKTLLVFEKDGKTYSAFYAPATSKLTLEKNLPEITLP